MQIGKAARPDEKPGRDGQNRRSLRCGLKNEKPLFNGREWDGKEPNVPGKGNALRKGLEEKRRRAGSFQEIKKVTVL